MKALFKEVDSGKVILHNRGTYRQLKLYEFDGKLFAGNGRTFVRLHQGGSTSTAAKWAHIDSPDYIHDKLGHLKLTQ